MKRFTDMTEEERAQLLSLLRKDICPDCGAEHLSPGPRGGAGMNIFCDACGAGFNVTWPRYIEMVDRIREGR